MNLFKDLVDELILCVLITPCEFFYSRNYKYTTDNDYDMKSLNHYSSKYALKMWKLCNKHKEQLPELLKDDTKQRNEYETYEIHEFYDSLLLMIPPIDSCHR